jgi:hypothetical protein
MNAARSNFQSLSPMPRLKLTRLATAKQLMPETVRFCGPYPPGAAENRYLPAVPPWPILAERYTRHRQEVKADETLGF